MRTPVKPSVVVRGLPDGLEQAPAVHKIRFVAIEEDPAGGLVAVYEYVPPPEYRETRLLVTVTSPSSEPVASHQGEVAYVRRVLERLAVIVTVEEEEGGEDDV